VPLLEEYIGDATDHKRGYAELGLLPNGYMLIQHWQALRVRVHKWERRADPVLV
jgi:hypothetical protein